MDKLPVARTENMIVQEAGKELLIYDLISNKAYALNETSKLVFNLCDGHRSISKISWLMSQRLKIKINVTEDLIRLTIDDLKRNELIETSEPVLLTGKTRRELIRKIGLATMLALPLITSLVAPKAAAAQSITSCGASCTTASQCTSGCTTCKGTGVCFSPNGPPCVNNADCVLTGTCQAVGFFGEKFCSVGVFSPCSNIGSSCTANAVCVFNNGVCG